MAVNSECALAELGLNATTPKQLSLLHCISAGIHVTKSLTIFTLRQTFIQ